MNLIAIDPGAKGGLAIKHHGTVMAHKMPETPTDIFELIKGIGNEPVKAYVEEVSGYISGEFQPGSSMFNFGRSFGQIEGILIGLRIPFEMVRPQRWQKTMAIGTSGKQKCDCTGMTPDQAKLEKKRISQINSGIKRDWKNKLKDHAQRLYPHLKVTLSTCDALLLLEYARRMENQPAASVSMPAPQPHAALL